MKPFNIKLSDEHRAKLEKYRAVHGLRSEADAVRHLIDRDFTAFAPVDHPLVALARERGAAAASGKPFHPHPKPGKAK